MPGIKLEKIRYVENFDFESKLILSSFRFCLFRLHNSYIGLEYLDLCLVHWPMAYQEGGELFPKDPTAGGEPRILLADEIDYLETWRALEQCVRDGKVRSIGLSNFNTAQIRRIIENAEIRPAVLQVGGWWFYTFTPGFRK